MSERKVFVFIFPASSLSGGCYGEDFFHQRSQHLLGAISSPSAGKELPCPHSSGSPGNCTCSLHDQENSKAIGASRCLYDPKIDSLLKFHTPSPSTCPWFLIIQCATCFLGTLTNTYSNYELLLTHTCCLTMQHGLLGCWPQAQSSGLNWKQCIKKKNLQWKKE